MSETDGGAIIARVLKRNDVLFLYTLCGGHISPILVGAKKEGLKVVDVRDEVSAVFAADATARMSGTVGVAAVTAGPGVTNAVTAVKNAQMAQSPLILFGGATATVLRGRGSLQDIDQLAIMRPITKWATSVKTLSSLEGTVQRAFEVATSGTPGPVFIEVPVDLLYREDVVKEWYMKESGVENATGLGAKALELYLRGHLYKQFHAPSLPVPGPLPDVRMPGRNAEDEVSKVAEALAKAQRPVLVVGSQTLVIYRDPEPLSLAIESLGIPTFLGGTARGLLGHKAEIQLRHKRSAALKKADLVIVAGFPFDFRLGYGRSISSKATLVAANLSRTDLRKNRRPEIALQMHPGTFLENLACKNYSDSAKWGPWFATLREREVARDAEIASKANQDSELVDPLHFFQSLESQMADDAVLVVDGGDFVATAAYILRPRKPLCWLDPGVFGTLGVGGGFAVGAGMCRPGQETWLIYGDGSSAYSLAEMDTCVRHGLAPIAVIGTDGSWAQIAREQGEILGDLVGTELRRCDYHKVAEGYGAKGLLLDDPSKVAETIAEAKAIAKAGHPVVLNVMINSTDFRKGSISM
ncbi:MAG: thiamine pyrophosphate-binding protein [Myxococcales bacterium]|nr:thiamine pyrophosphate-binding protein [Myxococcales bacterium]